MHHIREFVNIIRDDDINKITNKEEDAFKYSLKFKTTTGFYSSNPICTLPSIIITRAFQNCCYRMQYDLQSLLVEVADLINKLRNLANGKEEKFSIFVGISGIHLENIEKVNFSDDLIIRKNDSFSNPATRLNLIASSENRKGSIIEIIYSTSIITITHNPEFGTYTGLTEELYNHVNKCLEKLKFSICFTVNKRYAFIDNFTEHGFPTEGTPNGYYSNLLGRGFNDITDSDIRELRKWYSIISSVNVPNIQIAFTRLDNAMHKNTNLENVFTDCMVALESMFSSKRNTRGKFAGSITKFLNPQATEEEERKLKYYYDIRSYILHGGGDKNEMRKYNNKIGLYGGLTSICSDTLTIALDCLKKLICDENLRELSSEKRCDKILNINSREKSLVRIFIYILNIVRAIFKGVGR